MQMRAMIFTRPGAPLRLEARPIPLPGPGQLLLRVHACGICRTDEVVQTMGLYWLILNESLINTGAH